VQVPQAIQSIIWSKSGKMGGKTQSRQCVSTTVLRNIVFSFVLALPVSSTTIGVSTYRPFPKGSPTGRGDERLVQLRMNGAVPKDVSKSKNVKVSFKTRLFKHTIWVGTVPYI